ncbi:MAG: FecR domain-containing protein [Candidatus Neomarinimicrobiota bacterium]
MKKLIGIMSLMLILGISLLMAQTQYATILKVTGSANLRPKGAGDYSVPITASMSINVGDAIKTGADGFVAIIFTSDKSLLKIRKDTELELKDEFNSRTAKISQGKVLAEITPGLKTSFRIETPTSVASVKGTKFWAVIQQGFGDKFYGVEGQVSILNLITGMEASLGAGQMVASTVNGDLFNLPVDPDEMPQDTEGSAPKPDQTPAPSEQGMEEELGMPDMGQTTPTGEQPAETAEEGAEGSKGAKKSKPFGMGLGLGSVTIDGKIYNQIALRPELKLGKLAVSLDIAMYMDEQGNIRKDEWDEVSDYIDKIYYVRWGQQGDPFFAKVGALDNVTMGYGILLNGYCNTTEYPQVRKVGVHTGMQGEKVGWEAFMANAKEITGPGLLGGRVTYKPIKALPLTIGGTIVTDFNQYKGLKDTDDDNVPDAFDAFPINEFTTPNYFPGFSDTSLIDHKYYNIPTGETELKGSKFTKDTDGDGIPDEIDYDVDGDGMTDSYPNTAYNFDPNVVQDKDPFNTENQKKTLTAAAVDVGYPVLNMKLFKLHLYGQAATFISKELTDYTTKQKFTPGYGIAAPGLRMNIFKIVNTTVEYRYAGENFLYGFWDRAYDFERVAVRTAPDGSLFPYTKDEMRLMNESMQGVYGAVDVNILNYIILGSYYQHMFTSGTEIKSFMATATVPKGKIPKLADATAFYQRNNDANPFDFKHPSENTILGYKVGFELGGGATIYYVFQKTFRDYNGDGKIDPKTESVSLTSIETGFSL